jgi:PKD repeat protein
MSIASKFIPTAGLALAACAGMAQVPCDSLHHVGFEWQDIGNYDIQFTPDDPVSGAVVYSTDWGFAGPGVLDFSTYTTPQYNFPGPGDYLACLQATVQDDQWGSCASTDCHVVAVPPDTLCAGLVAAFNINLDGAMIQFIDQSQSTYPILNWYWDFGDGSTSSEAAPAHNYTGPGPFRACLTVSNANCTATSCNWIYWGPPNVPCNTLLQPDFSVIQLGQSIAVLDQSVVSGMNSSVSWDFGDGATGSGSPLVHTYAYEGYFQVCATVALWGPLTPDTCSATICTTISTNAATGIPKPSTSPGLRAWPVPFTSFCTVEGIAGKSEWELSDAWGRIRAQGTTRSEGPLVIEGGQLAAGSYFLRITTEEGTRCLRLMKMQD